MNLQTDYTVYEFGRRIRKVHNFCAVELCNEMRAMHRNFQVIPLARLQRLLALCRGHRHPAAPAAFVQTARMFSRIGVDLYLHSLNVVPMRSEEHTSEL